MSRAMRLRDAVGDAGDDHPAVTMAEKDDVVQVLEKNVVHDVVDVRGEADVRRGRVEMLAKAAERRPVDLPAPELEQRRDFPEVPAAGPRTVDGHEHGLLVRRLRGGQDGAQANASRMSSRRDLMRPHCLDEIRTVNPENAD